MKILVPKEVAPGETRVAATPETVKRYVKEGFEVTVESGAGEGAFIADARVEEAGAKITADLATAWGQADLVLKVQPLGPNEKLGRDEPAAFKPGAGVVALLSPHKNLRMVRELVTNRITALAM